jgi:Uma2 family endonuclease
MGKLLERNPNKKPTAIPELRDGDMLDTKEFLRRYEAMPEGTRAELLGGVVWLNRWVEVLDNGRTRIMPPISGGHSTPQTRIVTFFQNFADATDGVLANGPRTVVLNGIDSTCEPDGLLYLAPECGGSAAPGEHDYLYGPPELVLEVSKTTAAKDLGTKRSNYEKNGVLEYIVWQVDARTIHWFVRDKGKYQLLDTSGVTFSKVFPTFCLDIPALLDNRWNDCRRALERSLASPEHARFVEKLRKIKAKKK